MSKETTLSGNISTEEPYNWPGLAAAGALFIVGWMLVHAYGELPEQAVMSATEISENPHTSVVKASTDNDWASVEP